MFVDISIYLSLSLESDVCSYQYLEITDIRSVSSENKMTLFCYSQSKVT